MADTRFKLTQEWTALSDLITIDSSKTYQIYNQGPNAFVKYEGASKPSNKEQAGVPVAFDNTLVYEKGSENIYLRAINGDTYINIL